MRTGKRIVMVVCLVLACFFVLASCKTEPPPVGPKPDTQRPVIDLSAVQSDADIGKPLTLDMSATDNVTPADNLLWDVQVEKDGLDVTAKTYTAANKTFTPTSVGVYGFTVKVTDEAGNYIIRTFSVNADIDVWQKKDFTFTTAAGTATTSQELDYVQIGKNGIEFATEYAPFAYTYAAHPMRKFDLVADDAAKTPVELKGSFFIEFDYADIDSYQNLDNSRIALEFTRKGTSVVDEVYIFNNYTVLEYFTNIAGVGASGTGIYVPPQAPGKTDKIKIGRFVNEAENACTYVFYHNNVPSAYNKVAGNYGDEVTVKLYSYKSKGKIANLRLGMFEDEDAPALTANEDFPISAVNNEQIDLNRLFIEDNIVPEKFVEVLYDVKDKDNAAVTVDFNRTFRASKVGTYAVKIKAKDLTGNVSEEIVKTVSVSDTQAPTIDFKGQVTGVIVGSNALLQPAVADNFTGAVAVTHRVLKNGAPTTDATATASAGVYTFNATVAGTYALELTATDVADNVGVGTHEIEAIAADTQAPKIAIDDPGQLMTQMANIMYWNVEDDVSAPDNITVTSRMVKGGSIDADTGAVTGGTALAASGTPGITANWYNPATRIFSTYNRGANSTGDYHLEVTATDEANNFSKAAIKVNVKQTGDVYDTTEYVGWGWESYHNRDKYVGIVLGKDSVTIPSRSTNTGDQLNFVPYIRRYFTGPEVMNGDFDFDIDYEDITAAISSECTVRIMLYYATDAENTMGRQTDTVGFGATSAQSWLEININQSGSWQNGPKKIALTGKHHLKVERRIFRGNAYYRFFVDEVCLNPDGQNVGAAYKQYLVGMNFFGHKAGGKFSNIRFTQK
ncbi:hypothetical protein FACS1894211_04990 [Clostridia bacterium]|nr:hypothetical protein FACS1894211_04990 [Clostridia bacterium]